MYFKSWWFYRVEIKLKKKKKKKKSYVANAIAIMGTTFSAMQRHNAWGNKKNHNYKMLKIIIDNLYGHGWSVLFL